MRAVHRFEQLSSAAYIVAITVNEDFTKMLVTCSDRVLILYKINVLAKHTVSKATNQRLPPQIFEECDKFQDVINRKRWINTAFVKLGETTRIVDENGGGN